MPCFFGVCYSRGPVPRVIGADGKHELSPTPPGGEVAIAIFCGGETACAAAYPLRMRFGQNVIAEMLTNNGGFAS